MTNEKTIYVNEVKLTTRWKTVRDCDSKGYRITSKQDAIEQLNYTRQFHIDKDDSKHIKLRTKRAFGFYFVQARLETRRCAQGKYCASVHEPDNKERLPGIVVRHDHYNDLCELCAEAFDSERRAHITHPHLF